MAAVLLRRTVATAGLAALATVASPLVGIAMAAGFSGTISTDPADSSGTVAANRPTFIATYTDDLASSSTITVKQGSTAVTCPKTVSGQVVECTPSADLVDGKDYTVTAHGVAKADPATTADAGPTTYTVDIPSLTSANPADGQVVGSGNGPFTMVYDEAIDKNGGSTVEIRNSHNNVVDGTLSYSASTLGGATDTIKFTPSQTLPTGSYVATWHAQANGNPLAYADNVVNFTVNSTLPPSGPTVTTAGYLQPNTTNHFVNADNEAAVPFAGTAPKGYRVGVLVYDKSAPPPPVIGGLGPNDSTANTAVQDCADTTCPWSLTVDTSGTPEKAYQYYVYVYSAAGKVPSASNSTTDPVITKDITAPAPPQAISTSIDGNIVTVDDSNPDTSTVAWNVMITDSEGTVAHEDNVPATSNGTKDLHTTVDVSSPVHLVDGDLTIDDQAIDAAGNLSQIDEDFFGQTKETDPLTLDTAASFVTVNGVNRSLADINGAVVKAPTSITMRFNEPLKLKVMDSSGSHNVSPVVLFASRLCLADESDLCIKSPANIALTSDGRGFVWTPQALPSDGVYRIRDVRAFAATCPDKSDFTNTTLASCEHFITSESTSRHPVLDPLATFTIDDTAPQAAFTSWPTTITSSNYGSAGVAGTVDKDATSLQLVITSSAEPSNHRLVDAVPVTPPADSAATRADWPGPSQLFLLPLAGLADGRLTIQAKATDAAGNTTAAPLPAVTATLDALRFSAVAGDASAVLKWSKPRVGGANQPITSYRLGVTDLTAGSPTVTKTLDGSKTSYVVRNLVNGHSYGIRLVARDSSGNGPTALATVAPRAATTLTEKTSAKTVTYGRSITLTGRLTRSSDNHGLSGVTLTIRPRFDDGSFGSATKVKTDSFGFYKKTLKPAHNATYYVSYAGSRVNDPASSHAARTLVRVRIAFTAPRDPGAVGSPVTLKGVVAPGKAGRYVSVYRHTSNGNTLLGRARLSSTSTWTFRLAIPRGTTTVFAKIGNTRGNLGNRTGYLRLTH